MRWRNPDGQGGASSGCPTGWSICPAGITRWPSLNSRCSRPSTSLPPHRMTRSQTGRIKSAGCTFTSCPPRARKAAQSGAVGPPAGPPAGQTRRRPSRSPPTRWVPAAWPAGGDRGTLRRASAAQHPRPARHRQSGGVTGSAGPPTGCALVGKEPGHPAASRSSECSWLRRRGAPPTARRAGQRTPAGDALSPNGRTITAGRPGSQHRVAS